MTPLDRFRYIRTLRMPSSPKLVLLILASHADKDGGCWLLQSTLAAECGCSIRSIGSAIAFLNSRGLLIHVRHGHRASTFQLTFEAFQLAQRQSAPVAERNRQPLPTEVAPRRRTRKRIRIKPIGSMQCASCRRTTHNLYDGHLCQQCARHANPNVLLFPEARK